MELTTKINGFLITFMNFDEGSDDSNNCYIEKGEFSSSLSFAKDNGGIENENGQFLYIPFSILNKMTDWAISRGY